MHYAYIKKYEEEIKDVCVMVDFTCRQKGNDIFEKFERAIRPDDQMLSKKSTLSVTIMNYMQYRNSNVKLVGKDYFMKNSAEKKFLKLNNMKIFDKTSRYIGQKIQIAANIKYENEKLCLCLLTLLAVNKENFSFFSRIERWKYFEIYSYIN